MASYTDNGCDIYERGLTRTYYPNSISINQKEDILSCTWENHVVLYAGIVRNGRDHMFFTMDEVALIDGLIATYFVADSVSESVRIRYYKTHQHLQDNRTDYADLRNIKEALFFLAPLFHGSIQFEKEIWSVIAKTQRLLKESSPVAE